MPDLIRSPSWFAFWTGVNATLLATGAPYPLFWALQTVLGAAALILPHRPKEDTA